MRLWTGRSRILRAMLCQEASQSLLSRCFYMRDGERIIKSTSKSANYEINCDGVALDLPHLTKISEALTKSLSSIYQLIEEAEIARRVPRNKYASLFKHIETCRKGLTESVMNRTDLHDQIGILSLIHSKANQPCQNQETVSRRSCILLRASLSATKDRTRATREMWVFHTQKSSPATGVASERIIY